jgi:hypothetical protein
MDSFHEDLKEANLRQLSRFNKRQFTHIMNKIMSLESQVKDVEGITGWHLSRCHTVLENGKKAIEASAAVKDALKIKVEMDEFHNKMFHFSTMVASFQSEMIGFSDDIKALKEKCIDNELYCDSLSVSLETLESGLREINYSLDGMVNGISSNNEGVLFQSGEIYKELLLQQKEQY